MVIKRVQTLQLEQNISSYSCTHLYNLPALFKFKKMGCVIVVLEILFLP